MPNTRRLNCSPVTEEFLHVFLNLTHSDVLGSLQSHQDLLEIQFRWYPSPVPQIATMCLRFLSEKELPFGLETSSCCTLPFGQKFGIKMKYTHTLFILLLFSLQIFHLLAKISLASDIGSCQQFPKCDQQTIPLPATIHTYRHLLCG